MTPRKRIALVVLLLSASVGCDQKTKHLAREHLGDRPGVSFLAGILRLDYAENTGGFLSLGAFLPAAWRAAIFNVACSAGMAAVLLYTLFAARINHLQVIGLSLICGGGIGNLIDRWSFGYARDFLNIGVGPIRTGIFNVADVALMAGCLLVLWSQRSVAQAGKPAPR